LNKGGVLKPRTGLKAVLSHLPEELILVIGPGINGELNYIRQPTVAIDIDPRALKAAKSKTRHLVMADINQGLPIKPNSFSCIFLSHVLEHLDSPIEALRQINGILKESGILIIGLPHEGWLVEKFHKYYQNHPDHLYSFSLNGILRLLSSSGFKANEFYFDMPYRFGPFLRIAIYLANKLPIWLVYPFAPSFWLIARKSDK